MVVGMFGLCKLALEVDVLVEKTLTRLGVAIEIMVIVVEVVIPCLVVGLGNVLILGGRARRSDGRNVSGGRAGRRSIRVAKHSQDFRLMKKLNQEVIRSISKL